MHDAQDFLTTLALVLGIAALTTALFQKLRQPVVLGYLLAGMIVSPHIPIPIVADERTVHTLSELGVILLMFSLGLEFSLHRLWQVAPTAGLIAVLQCSLLVWLGYMAGQAFGWTNLESIYTGAMIAISSTTIIVRAFAERGIGGKLSELVFGILIVEDLVAVLLLAILTPLASGSGLSAAELAWTVTRLALFLVVFIAGGLLIAPGMFRAIVRLDRAETTLVASVGFCFALALVARAAGYSVALGAFLAGAMLAGSGVARQIEHLVQPVRDMFAAIFFVAVGMLFDPELVVRHGPAVVVLTLVVVAGKIVGVTLGALLTGFGIPMSIRSGMSLAQIGEFSFIIAGVGSSLGATADFLYPVAVAVSVVTTFLTPWLIRWSEPVATYADRRLPRRLQLFAALYGSWLERLRTAPREPSTWQHIRRLAGLLVADAAFLATLLVGASLSFEHLSAWLQEPAGSPLAIGWLMGLAGSVLLSVPFCWGMARCARSLASLLAVGALPANDSGGVDAAAAPRRALVVVLQLALLLVVGIPLVALLQPFLPAMGGAAFLAAMTLTFALALWRTAADLQGHVRASSQAIAEFLARQLAEQPPASQADGLAALEKLLPGLGGPTVARLPADSPAVGRSLVQLNLRGKTGATVLAIGRGAEGFLPSGKERLEAGDLLALAGTHDAIAAARELLASGNPQQL